MLKDFNSATNTSTSALLLDGGGRSKAQLNTKIGNFIDVLASQILTFVLKKPNLI